MKVRSISSVLAAGCLLLVLGCGPETITLKGGLDTPAQHVANGNELLKNGKLEAALREFEMAKELLDSEYTPVYVGMGLVYGQQGDFARARGSLEQANRFARSVQEKEMVSAARATLDRLEGRPPQ